MKNRVILFLLMLLFIIVLSATYLPKCRLAQEEYSVAKNTDQLCGVFVTMGSQDLQLSPSSDEDTSVTYSNNSFVSTDNLSDSIIEGIVNDDKTVSFKGNDGYYLGLTHSFNDKGEADYYALLASDGLLDAFLSVNVKSNKNGNSLDITTNTEEYSLEATLYVITGYKGIIQLNRVYQRPDGTCYAPIDQGPSSMINGNCSQTVSQSISDSSTLSANVKSHIEKISFTIHATSVDAIQKIIIKEMSQGDDLIKASEYRQSDPKNFIVGNNTNYVIVEELSKDIYGKEKTKRSIYDLDRDNSEEDPVSHICFFPRDDYRIEVKSVTFKYK